MKAFPCTAFKNPAANTPYGRYTPAMLKAAYGCEGDCVLSGEGVKIAIVSAFACNKLQSELDTFSDTFSLPRTMLEQVKLGGQNRRNTLWEREAALDTELCHAFAPRAEISVIVTGSDEIDKLMHGAEFAAKNGAQVVCMSFGVTEREAEDFSEELEKMSAALPQDAVYVCPSGDVGGVCSFPASSVKCLGVGGTVLEISPDGRRLSDEKAWENGGGGVSAVFGLASAQKIFRPIPFMSGGNRATPDVSFFAAGELVADGVAVYSECSGGWTGAVGTSIGAPVWSAVAANCIEMSQGRISGCKDFSEFIYGVAGATSYSNAGGAFCDIKLGGNVAFQAGPGFDFCTGLGSPDLSRLILQSKFF